MFFLLSLLFASLVYASECEVYGISNGPQKLNCSFNKIDVSLTCKEGIYFLNDSVVEVAYHLEVERGSVPLVFKSTDFELIVLIKSPKNIKGELLLNGRRLPGKCEGDI